MSSYHGSEPWYDEEFSPSSFQLEVREKIINLEQSRDETLDEYLSYFDSIVMSCPHHGFTNFDLLQRFLGGMMPHEWNWLNDAAGGSVNNLDMDDLWNLIDDLAERSRQDQAMRLEELANMVHQFKTETESWAAENRVNKVLNTKPRVIKEEPTWKPTEPAEPLEPVLNAEQIKPGPVLALGAPEEVPDLNDGLAETDQDAPELAETCPVLTDGLVEKGPVLMAEKPQLNPLCFMQIIATEEHVVNNDAVQGELEANQGQEKPMMERSFTTTQQSGSENSLVPRQPISAATKKKLGRGACLMSPTLDGTMLNFQTYKGANHLNMKKRQRHGPKEWKPGWSSKRPRLNGPAAMAKEPSSSRLYVEKNPPDQWRLEPSTSLHAFFGRSKRATEKKFDLKHPWDPNL